MGSVFDDLMMIDRIQDANGKLIYESKQRFSNTIMEPEIADQITSILEKAINEGTGRQLRNRFGIQSELAGKTGTAQNYSDAWFVAYTPDIVIGCRLRKSAATALTIGHLDLRPFAGTNR